MAGWRCGLGERRWDFSLWSHSPLLVSRWRDLLCYYSQPGWREQSQGVLDKLNPLKYVLDALWFAVIYVFLCPFIHSFIHSLIAFLISYFPSSPFRPLSPCVFNTSPPVLPYYLHFHYLSLFFHLPNHFFCFPSLFQPRHIMQFRKPKLTTQRKRWTRSMPQ